MAVRHENLLHGDAVREDMVSTQLSVIKDKDIYANKSIVKCEKWMLLIVPFEETTLYLFHWLNFCSIFTKTD